MTFDIDKEMDKHQGVLYFGSDDPGIQEQTPTYSANPSPPPAPVPPPAAPRRPTSQEIKEMQAAEKQGHKEFMKEISPIRNLFRRFKRADDRQASLDEFTGDKPRFNIDSTMMEAQEADSVESKRRKLQDGMKRLDAIKADTRNPGKIKEIEDFYSTMSMLNLDQKLAAMDKVFGAIGDAGIAGRGYISNTRGGVMPEYGGEKSTPRKGEYRTGLGFFDH